MTLGFSTKINGKPNFFIEKIWEGLLQDSNLAISSGDYLTFQSSYLDKFGDYWDGTGKDVHQPVNPKLHTIRRDEHDRWISGMNIHTVINNRTKNRFQFAPVILCKSVQQIEIRNCNHLKRESDIGFVETVIVGEVSFSNYWKVTVDSKELSSEEIELLAVNDGFSSANDFFAYFNEDFNGKIIHWSDLKY